MPYYDFLNKKTDEIKSLFFGMNDEKKYIDSDGFEWERQFSIPLASIDSQSNIDPFDHKRGLEKIKNTRGTIGNQQDFAAEQSAKREEKLGVTDPVKSAFFKKYSDSRGGKQHPLERQEKVKKLTKEVMIKLNKKLK